MKYSLLSLILLVALVAIELLCIKHPINIVMNSLIYLVSFFVLGATWGAFCLEGKLRQFCKGACVLAWAWILYAIFVRTEEMSRYPTTPLARYVWQHIEPGAVQDSLAARKLPGEDNRIELDFIRTWTLLGILNAGLLGGILAIQIRSTTAGIAPQIVSSAGEIKASPESAL
jgi:hypothetical protein